MLPGYKKRYKETSSPLHSAAYLWSGVRGEAFLPNLNLTHSFKSGTLCPMNKLSAALFQVKAESMANMMSMLMSGIHTRAGTA